ncbi:MAG: thioredoxin-disulfide reductase [Candidatus Doudnabacteria bacterium RIFCSPLOWO2_01_FULL_44_21]|uniref:Thioredoxin reductase n=1 Tax=Candidatus Doudnabacteria bacterium RIFCSPLOWO2_01_FULL_44_21 TaxID=1817841 RepID=A0A1F5PY04_9BACT|nr:MAG: thioredoxin-disulfide reductase [Candidatus Doudnabacteria bacterium RIFCSPHIGHO2_02_FULL_43_13b]OGE94582.1 MAG: thioredoxin-disulfide reductase [Candidatus Doudnabacteria bacterium RIFCSPLOWO2_01_FULL_44_21]
MELHKVIIIGSGPAGLTAGIYAARADLKPLVLAGLNFGGQLMLTTEVENFPGFHKGIQGPELMQNFIAQTERFGGIIKYEDVTKVDFSKKPFKVWTAEAEYSTESVIIATGASSMWLGLPSEDKFRGHGISACATCDGFFFKNKEIVVVGGGDAAMEEASYLTKFAKHVTVIHRSDKLRASKIMQDRALANPKIRIEYNKVVEEFLGNDHLTGVKVKDLASNKSEERAIDGVFIAIGHKPNTEIFQGQIELDVKGYIVPKDGTKTSIDGVFVGGDVRDYRYRQAVTAAGMGCMAAMDAEKYLHLDQG